MKRREFLAAATAAIAAGCSLPDDSTPNPNSSVASATSDVAEQASPDLSVDTPGPREESAVRPSSVYEPTSSFPLGVASGDPDSSSVILWTGLLPIAASGDISLKWELATDSAMQNTVRSGVTVAVADEGFTTHVLADGLTPNTTYFYRFGSGEQVSGVGRTRTLPTDAVDRFGVAVSSCQARDQPSLWDNHLALASDPAVDLVVWLGDFIYEQSARTVAEYRGRYVEARSDARLHASAAAHPWLIGWDDHEVANDYDFGVDIGRRAAAYQAWWEFTPTRLPRPDQTGLRVYRHVDIGSMARLLLLDCRQYQSADSVLGPDQLRWLTEGAKHAGIHTVVASPVLMSSLRIGDLTPPYAFEAHPADQDALLLLLSDAPNPLIVSGDLHAQMELEFAPGITELMAPPISSLFRAEWADLLPFLPFGSEAVRSAAATHGYLRLDIGPKLIDHTFVAS